MNGRVISSSELNQATRLVESAPVFKVDDATIVKSGDCVRLAEAAAMELVRQQTTIPVPQIFNAYTDPDSGHARIVMEFVEGDVLEDVWDKLSPREKAEIISQLHDFWVQLRNVKGSFIGSVDFTACEDQLFTDELGAYGPYPDETAFNCGITKALRNSQQGAYVDMICGMVANALHDHEIVLTHGDFSPRNILIQGSKVVAVLDWEMCGYYPEYWEYAKALYRPAWESGWIREAAVDQILKPYFMELAVLLHTRDIVW